MKKILKSVFALSAVIVVVGTVTLTSINDNEEVANNVFEVGTMDLKVNDQDSPVAGLIDLSNQAPGSSGSAVINLVNEGSLDGVLNISMGNILELACNPDGANDGTEFCTTDAGSLGSNMEVAIYLDADGDGEFNTGDVELLPTGEGLKSEYSLATNSALDYIMLANYQGDFWNEVGNITAGDLNNDFVVNWKVYSAVSNTIQGDGLNFGVDFSLEQVII